MPVQNTGKFCSITFGVSRVYPFSTAPTAPRAFAHAVSMPGWHCDITAARKWEDLPKEAQAYVEYLEKAVGCKITYISVGAEREAYVHHV